MRGFLGSHRWLAPSLGAAALLVAVGCAFFITHGPGPFPHGSSPALATVEVDEGDVSLIVTETGVLESSVDDVVRCRVESLLGLPVGAPPAGASPPRSQAARARIGGGSLALQSRETGLAGVTRAMSDAKARMAAHSGVAPRAGSAKGSDSRFARNTAATGSSNFASSNPAPTFDSPASLSRSAIRSFEYVIEPHVPLRQTLPDLGVMATTAPAPLSIISIIAEGSHVKAGDVVCELDSSALRDALIVQQLRFAQAKAWVEQAKYALEADNIALREFEAGVLPQDVELVRQNIAIRRVENEQAARNLAWSRRAFAKGFRTETQVNADAAVLEQTEIALRNAEGMLVQLEKYTGKRIIKACKARIEAIVADLLSLEWSFRLERQRLKRIETMVANCTLRAPRDGMIVYANPPFTSSTSDTQIREGLIVHNMQPIFRLLDPDHIRVRARINESQVARIRPGLPVEIHLEAFPDQPLQGRVGQIDPIPSTAGGASPDVRSFFATVRIESGAFDEMTTGLTAELDFMVETRRHVTRVPLEAVRWIGDHSFAAMLDRASGEDWQWRSIALGVTDAEFAEVISGLEPGDRVIAHSETLPEADLPVPALEAPLDLAQGGNASTR
jgi:HlyD family secretion protein